MTLSEDEKIAKNWKDNEKVAENTEIGDKSKFITEIANLGQSCAQLIRKLLLLGIFL